MFGILLQGIANLLGETSGSLEKWMVKHKVESFYAVGFQNSLISLLFFVATLFWHEKIFAIDPRSYPTLALLVLLSVAQAYATMKATTVASRGTFNFIRTGTIPLLLVSDLFLGRNLSVWQISGIILIILTLLFLFLNHGIERKGAWLVIFTTINGALCLGIYSYHINTWNSVPAEQTILITAQAMFFLACSIRMKKENPFKLLSKRLPLLQSVSYAGTVFIESFAYLFAPASVIVAASRSFAVLWGIVFGNRIFHEKALKIKITALAFILIGIVLITRS